MEAVVLVIHLIVALGIVAVVLVQPSEAGGFLGNSGSMSNMMAPRRSGDVLSRLTGILAGCFFLSSLFLAVMAGQRGPEKSILDLAADQLPAAAGTSVPEAKTQKEAVPVKAKTPAKEKPAAPISK